MLLNPRIRGNPSSTPTGQCARVGPYYDSPGGKGGKGWTLLGLIVAVALSYVTYTYLFPTTVTEVGIAGASILFLGGFLARRAKSGALVGFLLVFVPLALAGVVLMDLIPLPAWMGTWSEGVARAVESFSQDVGFVLSASLEIILLVAAALFGAAGAILAGVGGWVGGVVLPRGPPSYVAPDPYFDAEFPGPPR